MPEGRVHTPGGGLYTYEEACTHVDRAHTPTGVGHACLLGGEGVYACRKGVHLGGGRTLGWRGHARGWGKCAR
jgi:hypothetical protein